MWFDYEGEKVLVTPRRTGRSANHLQEFASDDFAGQSQEPLRLGADQMHGGKRPARAVARGRIRDQTARPHWHKYTGESGHYGLRDPKIDQKRVLVVCGIDRIATFGEP